MKLFINIKYKYSEILINQVMYKYYSHVDNFIAYYGI